MTERVTQLQCLLSIFEIASDFDKPIGDVFQKIVNLLPLGCQHIAISSARIEWDDHHFTTDNVSQPTVDLLETEIRISGITRGSLSLQSADKIAPSILDEEATLLRVVSKQLSNFIERKQYKEQIDNQHQRLQDIIDGTHAGTWEWNLQSGKVFFNHRWAEMFGYRPNELEPFTMATWEKFVHPDDLASANERLRQHFAGKSDYYEYDLRMRHKNGNWVWINDRGRISKRMADGTPMIISGTHIDITERHNAEERIRNSEALYRLLSENNNDVIWLYDIAAEGFVYFSPSAEKLTGYSVEELLRPDRQQAVTPLINHINTLLSKPAEEPLNQPSLNHEISLYHKNGNPVATEISTSLVTDQHGNISHIQGITRDISERKKNESELRKLWLAVEQSPNAIVITNLDAKIEYVNKNFTTLTGYKSEEILGNSTKSMHPSNFDRVTAMRMWEQLANGETWSGELIERCKNGANITVQAHIAPVRQADGRISHYIAIEQDITEQKRINKELEEYRWQLENMVELRTRELEQAKQRAEAANLAKSTFLANMSHEIRTPLNAIIGFTHLLKNDLKDEIQLDKINKISTSAKHLQSIINDILDLSKIDANRLVLQQTPLHIKTILEQIHSIMDERINSKRLLYIEELDQRLLPLSLLGDEMRIRQILINYLDNAIKFTEKGQITLRIKLIAEQQETVSLRFEVEDTGIGISQAVQQRLFNAFEQAETSTARKYGGTGLGLTISNQLARMMDGNTGVISAPNQGSLFWFTARLQKCKAVAYAGKAPSDAISPSSGSRILLVEDSLFNQQLTKELLERKKLVVDVAEHGGIALQKFQQNDYELILMDLQMPVMDGIEAARKIRNLPTGKTIPILALTANAFEEDRIACLEAGMNGHVSKPITPETLYATLAQWLPESKTAHAPTLSESITPGILKKSPLPAQQIDIDSISCSHIDKSLGLKHFAGNIASYQRMLAGFPAEHGDDARSLQTALARGDFTLAKIIAHTLKGVCNALGMTILGQHAKDLELKIQAGGSVETFNADIHSLETMLATVDGEIQALVLDKSADLPAMDIAEMRKLTDQLESELAVDDVKARQTWMKLRAAFIEVINNDTVSLLGAQIESFDFPAASNSLRAILNDRPDLKPC